MATNSELISAPIFLVGAERSGTTLLRLMLDHHPQLAFNYEFEYVVERVSDDGDWPLLNDYYEWLKTHRIFLDTGFSIDSSLNYPQLVNSFLSQKKERDKKPLVGATVHHHFDRLLYIWPNARFIHIIRDGRDVARSCIGMGWAGNVWTGVERWLEAEKLWENLEKRITSERKIEVIYEELIRDTRGTLKKLCDFIGIPYDEAMLNYAKTSTYELPDPSLTQQWRKKLSEYEIRLVESSIGKMLEERGYELSGLPPLTVSPLMETQLRLQDRWFRLQWRLKRFGLILVASDFLARRLKLKQWEQKVRLQLNAIESSYLK